jgi:hypothetical protein
MHYIVEAPAFWFLRGSTWTGDKDRAEKFTTKEFAQAALKNAAQFSKPRVVKTWKIVEITD